MLHIKIQVNEKCKKRTKQTKLNILNSKMRNAIKILSKQFFLLLVIF